MHQRCTNERSPEFKNYGARGIRVCERWVAFDLFLLDVGPRPSAKHSLDREDNEGNYEPTNCRWATPKQQTRNRRITKLSEAAAARVRARLAAGAPVAEIAREHGVSPGCIYEVKKGHTWAEDEVA
jgi:hypothetical protein